MAQSKRLAPLADTDTAVTVLTPSHGWVALRLDKVWEYRELLYFLTWRDIKIRYKQTINLLAEGMLFVDAALTTLDPIIHQFAEYQAVAFQIVDSLEGDTARGEWAGFMRGVVRPLLQWQTHEVQPVRGVAATVAGEK